MGATIIGENPGKPIIPTVPCIIIVKTIGQRE
jgi:hypothetical protein